MDRLWRISRRKGWAPGRVVAAALILAIALLLAACGGSTPGNTGGTETGDGGDEGRGDAGPTVLHVGLDVDLDTGDPRLMRNTTGWRVRELVFDGLVELDENLQPQPALAEDWETPDDTTWIFHLRRGVKFHDGSDFTAEDVVFTYTSVLDPNFGAPNRALYVPIQKVEAVDDYTVRFTLSQPYAPLLSYLDLGIVPAEAGQDFGSQPVGTGPFKFVSWQKNSKIELEANPDWWGGRPKIDRVVLHIIPDNTARALALEVGDVQLVHSPLSPQDLPNLEAAEGIQVDRLAALGYTYLNFNTADPILSDVRVRRALAMLIPQDVIVEQIYQGMDYPGRSPLVPAWPAYDDTIQQPGHDPEGAAGLLAEAGWSDSDGDGILDQGGRPLSITLKTHSEDPNRIQVVEYLQNVFSEAGIDARVETAEWPTFLDMMMKGEYQIGLLGWLNLVDPDRGMYNQFKSDGGNNWGRYSNPQVDEHLELGRSTLEPSGRAEHYRAAARILVEELPYYVLTYQGYVVAYHENLKGFVPNPRGSFRSLAFAEWTR